MKLSKPTFLQACLPSDLEPWPEGALSSLYASTVYPLVDIIL